MNRYWRASLVIAWAALSGCSDGGQSATGSGGTGTTGAGTGPTNSAGNTSAGSTSGGSASGGSTTGGSTTAGSSSGGSVSGGTSTGGASGGTGGSGVSGGSNAGSGGSSAGGTNAAGSGGAGGTNGGSAGAGGGGSTLPKRVLLYDYNATPTIPTTPQQITFLKTQFMTWGYEVDESKDPADINATKLAMYGAVGMVNTCFTPFGSGMGTAQTTALKAFVEGGGGLFGFHCASVAFQGANPVNPYNELLGGRAASDNFDGKSSCSKTTEAHVSTAMLPDTFDFTGNLDNEDYTAPDTKILVKCKWSGMGMKEVPVSWYRTAGKGRVFYTNFVKVDKDLSDATLGTKHVIPALSWVLGR